jgi:hypothetical protein
MKSRWHDFIKLIKRFFSQTEAYSQWKEGIAPPPMGHNDPPEDIEDTSPEDTSPEDIDLVLEDVVPPPAPAIDTTRLTHDTSKQTREDLAEHLEKGENLGVLYYMDDLLARMDGYYACLKRFKSFDRDSYDIYSRVGGHFTTKRTLIQLNKLVDRWETERPSFASLHMDTQTMSKAKDKREFPNAFTYIKKVKQPWYVEKTKGDIYVVSEYIDDVWAAKGIGVYQYHVAVGADCSIKLLKEKQTETKYIQEKTRRGGKNKKGCTSIREFSWHYPSYIQPLIDFNLAECVRTGKDTAKWQGTTPESYARNTFCLVANFAFNSSDGFKIMCTKERVTGSFNIDLKRTPYFFKDRVKVKNDKGSTKKIFHSVEEHTRKTEKGETIVKSHFRGLRKFHWGGYNVAVVHPRMGLDLNKFNIGSEVVDEDGLIKKAYLEPAAIGDQLKNLIER